MTIQVAIHVLQTDLSRSPLFYVLFQISKVSSEEGREARSPIFLHGDYHFIKTFPLLPLNGERKGRNRIIVCCSLRTSNG
jgi:hypothetical protein